MGAFITVHFCVHAQTYNSLTRFSHWDDDEAFPVDEDKILALLEQFREFGVSFEIDDVEDESQYGLDDPTCRIAITADEKEYEIRLGSFSTMDSERYVSIGDDKVYLVTHDPWEDFDLEIRDLIKNDETPVIDYAETILFSGKENYEVYYEKDSADTWCADDIYFTDHKPLDTSSVNEYLIAVSYLSLSDYVVYKATEEDLREYGLDEPEITAEIAYREVSDETEDDAGSDVAEVITLHIGRSEEQVEEAARKEAEETDALSDDDYSESYEDSEEEEGAAAYLRVGESPIIYEITQTDYETLSKVAYNDLRHKEVLTADVEDVEMIAITLEEKTYNFEAKGEEEERIWIDTDGKEVDFSAVESAIRNLSADSFTDEEAYGQEEIAFTLYLDNEMFPQIDVVLYRVDGEDCLCAVNGVSESLVPRNSVVDLIEATHAIVLGEEPTSCNNQ